jgi:hypothetical protein
MKSWTRALRPTPGGVLAALARAYCSDDAFATALLLAIGLVAILAVAWLCDQTEAAALSLLELG